MLEADYTRETQTGVLKIDDIGKEAVGYMIKVMIINESNIICRDSSVEIVGQIHTIKRIFSGPFGMICAYYNILSIVFGIY